MNHGNTVADKEFELEVGSALGLEVRGTRLNGTVISALRDEGADTVYVLIELDQASRSIAGMNRLRIDMAGLNLRPSICIEEVQ